MCHKNMSVSLFYLFVTSWAWKFKNIKGTSFISTHTLIQGCISVLYKSLLSWAKGMFMVPCSKFQFVHNSNLSFKEELNIFLLDLRSKYVLCLLFLKEIFKISNYLCVEYLWPHFIILFELVDLHKSKNGSTNHFNWWVFPV